MTNVRWSHNDQYLVSTGGADTSVMVWTSIDAEERYIQGRGFDHFDSSSVLIYFALKSKIRQRLTH